MGVARRTILLLLLGLVAGAWPGSGLASERGAFDAASEAFHQGFYERAETGFADFRTKYPNSTRTAEAVLYQAEARLQLTNYAGAIELLANRSGQAGKLADEYLFWLAEARFGAGDCAGAAAAFEQLVRQHPASARRVEAAVGAAAARTRLEQWAQVIAQLRDPEGAFQSALRTNLLNESIVRGYLLLGKALFMQKDYPAAEAVLEPSGRLPLAPTLAWERQALVCRIQLNAGRPEDALRDVTNLLFLAGVSGQPALQAESAAFEAEIRERLGQPDQEIAAFSRNLASGMPPERQQQALLKIAELSRARGQLAPAIQRLEEFLKQYPEAAAADLAWLTLGELRLGQFSAATRAVVSGSTNAIAATNLLDRAAEALTTLTNKFPQSPLLGKAQLDLGACYWFKKLLPESQTAFQSAVDRLPFSADQASAYFNLGNAQFEQTNYAGAIASYTKIIDELAVLPEVRANLLESALYEAVRAGLAAGEQSVSTNALAKILTEYPNGFYADRAVLQAGQWISRHGNPAYARAIYQDFCLKATNAALLPDVQLAVARTYEQEANWDEAVRAYNAWLERFSHSPARPRAEYARAYASFLGGHDTNALSFFTNFVVQFPSNALAPRAQWWVGDYYFTKGDFSSAELSYQAISLNWPTNELAYQAPLAAGRAAAARQSWSDASSYFTNLFSQPGCPSDLKAKALYGYADAQMCMGDLAQTNKNANYELAIAAFDYLYQQYPTNPMAMWALGGKANCLLQRAKSPADFEKAFRAYQEVATNSQADVVTRGKAKVGMAVVSEKWAELESGAPRAKRLKAALDQYLDVFDDNDFLRPAEKPDLFWTKKAGLEAARLAEALNQWTPAIRVYTQLKRDLPVLSGYLDNKIRQAEKKSQPAKSAPPEGR